MIPSAFVTISELPLTPNGKVDRKALPAPEAQFILSAPYQPPATEIERTLVEIWSGVIGFQPSAERPTIGIGDNFFELGGDFNPQYPGCRSSKPGGHSFDASTVI